MAGDSKSADDEGRCDGSSIAEDVASGAGIKKRGWRLMVAKFSTQVAKRQHSGDGGAREADCSDGNGDGVSDVGHGKSDGDVDGGDGYSHSSDFGGDSDGGGGSGSVVSRYEKSYCNTNAVVTESSSVANTNTTTDANSDDCATTVSYQSNDDSSDEEFLRRCEAEMSESESK